MSTTATAAAAAAAAATDRPVTAKLIAPRADALKHLRTALDKGVAIKTLRIRNGDELDEARAQKLEWVQDCTDLLNQLFDNNTVADYVNDWVGKVFPEYAEFGNFVDQFYEEMDYRINKLVVIHKRIESAGEAGAVQRRRALVALAGGKREWERTIEHERKDPQAVIAAFFAEYGVTHACCPHGCRRKRPQGAFRLSRSQGPGQ